MAEREDDSTDTDTYADRLGRVWRHVDVLAGLIGERHTGRPTALDATRAYLHRELAEVDLTANTATYDAADRRAVNLEVVWPGTDPRRATLVVGAHYDTVPGTPGADDNASAVAVALEVARDLAGDRPRRAVRVVFYDCEEPPHFHTGDMGSQHHAASLRRRGERVAGMVCLESVGYFARDGDPSPPADPRPAHWLGRLDRRLGARHVALVSDLSSAGFGLRLWAAMGRGVGCKVVPVALPRATPYIGWSDHRSYWEQGYRAVMLTGGALLRNPHYHRPTDTPATLDLARTSALAARLCRAVRRLAGA